MLAAASCKRAPPPAPAASKSAAAAAGGPASSQGEESPPERPRCRPLPGSRSFVLESNDRKPTPVEGEGDDLPFSLEMGHAIAVGKGFAATALEPTADGMKATIALPGNSGPERVDLGPVHGDVAPPVVAAVQDSLLAAVMDGAPNGALIRIARVELGSGPRVTWGEEVLVGRDDSDVVTLAMNGSRGVLAWDDAEERRSVIRAMTVDARDPKKSSSPRLLSARNEDADSPVVTERQGGFWIGWISSGQTEKKTQSPADPNQNAEWIEAGPRFVMILPLDAAGEVAGAPISVTPPGGRITGFDLIEGANGGALVAVRDQASSKGNPIRVIHVRPDGTTETTPSGEEDVGSAAPVFLVDEGAPGERRAWLALATESESVRLVPIDAEGHLLGAWSTEPALGIGAPLAMSAGALLAARPHGRGVALDLFRCDTEPPMTKEPVKP